jgi:hypothetical protein
MKCQRTALTLDAFGALDRFAPVFDMQAYRRFRPACLTLFATSSAPMEREAFDLARQAGLAWPRPVYLPGSIAVRAARRAARAMPWRRRGRAWTPAART